MKHFAFSLLDWDIWPDEAVFSLFYVVVGGTAQGLIYLEWRQKKFAGHVLFRLLSWGE